jgi:hypothetical protein
MKIKNNEINNISFWETLLLTDPEGTLGRKLSPNEIHFLDCLKNKSVRLDSERLNHCLSNQPQLKSPRIHIFSFEKLNAFFSWMTSLSMYSNIYIIANSENHAYKNISFKESDLIVVFNIFPRDILQNDKCDIVILNRQIQDLDRYFSRNESILKRTKKVSRAVILNKSKSIPQKIESLTNYDFAFVADIIPYSINHNKTPSSGYVLLYMLNYFFAETDVIKRIKPIGFEFSDTGWSGHDWNFERTNKEMMGFTWL